MWAKTSPACEGRTRSRLAPLTRRRASDGPASGSEAGRDLRAAAVQEARAQRPQAPPRLARSRSTTCARSRSAARPKAAFDYTDGAAEGELSLAPGPPGVRGHRVPPRDPARRRRRRHVRQILGGPIGAAVRHRADRLHPADADRGRDRPAPARPGPPASRSPSPRSAPPRSRTSRRPTRTAATGSSSTSCATARSPTAWSSARPPPASTRCSSPSTPRSPAPGCATSATASPSRRSSRLRHDHQRDPAAVVVVRLPHHPEARVRVAVVDRRHRRRAAQRRDGPDDQLRRPRRSSARSGRARSSSRACRTSRTRSSSPTSASTASCSPTTAAASSTARRSRSTCCRTWSARSATTSR